MEITGKIAVVTGASMGIGEAIAKLFVEKGAFVVLLSRDAARSEVARKRIGQMEKTLALACDVRNREEIDRVISLTIQTFQRIDIWVNNAGHGLIDSLAQMDMSACRELFETNLFGTISAMQAVIPVMKQQGAGTIINISSVAGHIPLAYGAAYSGSKFAMNAMGKSSRIELRKRNINVLTEFSANAVRGHDTRRVRPSAVRGISAERVARATVEGYRRRKREVIVPWTMIPVVKLYQLFPGIVEQAMLRMAKPAD